MKTAFRKSFTRDLKKIKDQDVLDRVQEMIDEVEAADDFSAVSNLKKMAGTANYYRIRAGDYRVGLVLERNTVEFVRCLNRRDLYRFFP
jgi:mRNA interferase RelE/StbE